jgi:DNA polymerase (family 10)
VGDLDLLVAAPDGAAVCRHFGTYGDAREVLQMGATKAAVVLKSGLQVDLRVVPQQS